jgi:F-box-like
MKHLLIPPFVCQSLHRRREVLSTRRTRRAVPVVHLFPRKFPETSTQTKANMNSDERPKLDIVPQLGKLPDDLVAKILSFLDAASLVRQRSLNRSFRRLASDTTLWQGLCYNLWKDKIHVEREARDLVDHGCHGGLSKGPRGCSNARSHDSRGTMLRSYNT